MHDSKFKSYNIATPSWQPKSSQFLTKLKTRHLMFRKVHKGVHLCQLPNNILPWFAKVISSDQEQQPMFPSF